MGGGGYVAGPAGLAALRLGLPLVLTEADSHLGLANRMLARRARRVCLAFPIAGRDGGALPRHRPARPGRVLDADRARPAGASRSAPRSAVCWSSAAASARDRSTRRRSTHSRRPMPGATSSSFTSPAAAITRRSRSGSRAPAPERYRLIEYEPNLGDALAASDLVVARAGGSVFELAAAGKPAILIPFPHATARPPAPKRRLDAAGRGRDRDR